MSASCQRRAQKIDKKKKAQPLISALLDKAFVIFIAGFCPNGCNQHIFQSLTGLNFKMKDNLVEAVE